MNDKRNKYRNVVVLGAGESGCGAAVLAKKHGIKVFVSDNGLIKKAYKDVLSQYEIDFEEGGHTVANILSADLVIKSPGIPATVNLIRELHGMGTPIIDEIEFASWFTRARLIGITGSNGKTTTTLLIGRLLQKAGLDVAVAGNIGQSFARSLAEGDHDYFVLEISSFQLDGIIDFRADIAILLNITPDHLDRYDNDFQQYADSKFRITQNQSEEDAFIYWDDDPVIKRLLERHMIKARKYPFRLGKDTGTEGATMDDKTIIFNINKKRSRMTLEQLALQGKHNSYNSLAAGLAAKLLQIRKDTIKQGLSDFQNIAHRLEYVANVHGVAYINDSKATNINSCWYALESMDRPVVWIAGGVDKGNDYNALMPLVKKKVKALICLGLDNSKLFEAFADVVPNIVEAASADEAVFLSSNFAQKDDVVLLSPACASFDLFENYEDRGLKFKEAVKKL
jgi:UDP-N-acetylmuramoylalanine--D-glutamate ligase